MCAWGTLGAEVGARRWIRSLDGRSCAWDGRRAGGGGLDLRISPVPGDGHSVLGHHRSRLENKSGLRDKGRFGRLSGTRWRHNW